MSARSWLHCPPPTVWPTEIWACGLLTLGTLIAFCQVATFDFVNYDDPVYVYDNWDVQRGLFVCDPFPGINPDTIEWAFLERKKSAHWHPLTWLSLACDWSLYGGNAGGFHVTNLLLHLANTLLLFWVLRLSTGRVWPSFVVAGLFGWHPLHVESVAWITERKDMLSTFFWMLTMLVYVKYAQRLAHGEKVWRLYALTILFFAMGLLSKPMVVTLPCVLLLWDYWPLRRLTLSKSDSPQRQEGILSEPAAPFGPPLSWKWLLLEKAPLFVLSLAAGLWTSVVMHEGTVRRTGEVLTVGSRVENALLAAVVLLRKMVWPSDLAAYYPVKPDDDPITAATLAGVFLAFCTCLVCLARHKHPYLLMGWLWYLGTLLLVVLRLQAGSFTWADRYTYVPMTGIFIALVWGLCAWLQRFRWTLIAGFTAALLACLMLTWEQVKIWQNSETLWRHTLAVTEDNFLAHYDLGLYLKPSRPEEALVHFQEASRILPNVPEFRESVARTHFELFTKLRQLKPEEARKHLVSARQEYRWLMERFPDQPRFREEFKKVAARL